MVHGDKGITRYGNAATSLIGGDELSDNNATSDCRCTASASSPIRCSAVAEELLQGHANVLGDLTKQRRGKITSPVEWNCGAASSRITKLQMGAAPTVSKVVRSV